jgi:hypothetical protein
MEEEVWKKINDFEYEVSNFGKVRRIGKNELKLNKNTRGYLIIKLYKNSITSTKKVHRLVALAFIPNPDNKPLIDHIDNNPLNNHYGNLRWASYSENNCNTGCRRDNKLGMKGVYYNKQINKYTSQINYMNKHIHIGYYNTAEEAFEAYKEKAKELHGDFHRF